ncbi:uncharacterized protein N7506_005349 [Penicillium brevicompactum]|uniref:uncharacterized protein n=1 Tax=Penicillium brevicompactum TaxID=5074 RepID=UPI00254194AB|nr:uncharacterized protein N7506_005349 [Penicillium brevicompactum]KAJ5337327.1 hypothetical protein N7506_005349 [Penicillium brevicompactum]
MCENHPAVRHAVIAMSAWHTHLERIPASQKEHPDSCLALRHSTKAIACLRESLAREILTPNSSSLTHKKVMLVTCLAFTVLALFQGDLFSARNHLVSGYKIFKEWNVQEDKDFTGVALGQAFAQIHVHWFFCSHPEIFLEGSELIDGENWICPNTTAAPSKITPHLFSGVDQMDSVQKFRFLVSDLILNYTTCEFEIGPASSVGRGAAAVLTKLRLCRSRLTGTLVELGGLAPEDCDNLKACSLWIGIIEIKLAVAESPNPDEMAYDDHLEQFQHITDIARILADSATGSSETDFSPFSYRYSVLPALLWSAAKCRDEKVRRDMCSIMHKRPGDDYWVSATTVALKRLIDVESIEVKPGEIIPVSARAYWVNVEIQSEKSRVELRYRRPQYVSQSKHDGDKWERDSAKY